MTCEQTVKKYEAAYIGTIWISGSDHEAHFLYSQKKLIEMVIKDGVSKDDAMDFIMHNIVRAIDQIALLDDCC